MPWREDGIGDADYESAIDLVLLPVIRQFAPQLLLVSAGFDAADGDVQVRIRTRTRARPRQAAAGQTAWAQMRDGMRGVQGRMKLSPAGFGSMTAALLSLGARSPLSLLNLSTSPRGRLSAAMCSGHTHARRPCVIFSLFPSWLSVGSDAGGCCAGVPSVFALEGGYNIPVNSSSCEAVLRVLLGEAPPKRPEARLSRSCEDTLRAVMQVMREPSHAYT